MNRRGLLMNMITTAFVPAAVAAIPLELAKASPEIDPILALIDEHRDIWARWERAHNRFRRLRGKDDRANLPQDWISVGDAENGPP
jgi:hypothetical protein